MINIQQISKEFSKLPIESIGNESGFIKREQKLKALVFLMSFFESFSEAGMCKTSTWVQKISQYIGAPLTKQGFCKRMGWLCVSFCEKVLSCSIGYNLNQVESWQNKASWLKSFTRVFIEDSTAIKLPKALYSIYGGGSNETSTYAMARVQLRMELQTEKIHNISIRHYAENDTVFASDILSMVQEGDLIIRDLGYFVTDVFEKIQKKGAFFISRWLPRVQLRHPQTSKVLDLGKILSQAEQMGTELIEQNVFLGLKTVFQVRLIAIKVPQEVEKKRRQAALDREKRKGIKYQDTYFEHLGWCIYITNIPIEKFSALNIWAIYRLRWRIEIIFKTWKSHLKILETVKDYQYLNPCQITIRLYLIMTWIVLCLVPAYNFFAAKIYQAEKRYLSLAKFADYYRNHFKSLRDELNWNEHIPFVSCFCQYDKRKKYRNYFENLYIINLC